MKTINSLSLTSLALLLAACGGSGNSGGGAGGLSGDAGSAGAAMGGAGAESGSGEGANSGGGTAGGPGSGGTGGGTPNGGAAGDGGSANGGSAAGGSSAAGAGGSAGGGSTADDAGAAGNSADDGGVAGSGGAAGAGGGLSDAGADAAPAPLVPPPPAGVVAYAYAPNKSQDAVYEPDDLYAFNQAGGTITIDRSQVGLYTVEATNLTVPIHNVQVTAYDQAAYCRLGNAWTTGAFVWCHDKDGAAVDAEFSFLALGPAASDASFTGYAWAEDDAAAQYTPDLAHSYNASGSAMTARRAAVGTYSLEFLGLDLGTGNVQVRAQGTSNHCNVSSWFGDDVHVRCYDTAGALVDARYNVLVTQTNVPAISVIQGYATSVGADDPGGDITQTPGVYKFNAAGGSVTLTRSGTGSYLARFEGVNLTGANVQVTALGADKTFCNAGISSGDQLSVRCYDENGDAANSQFTVAAIK